MKYEDFYEAFEKRILNAMDDAAADFLHLDGGWADEDLPNIIPFIKKQAEKLYNKPHKYKDE